MRDERGNIYVEAVIAVAVVAVGLLPVFGGWLMATRAQGETARRNTALAVARSYIEPLHALSGAQWDSLPASEPITDAANPTFAIVRKAADRSGLAGLKDVTVTVSWKDPKGLDQSVTLATSVARRP